MVSNKKSQKYNLNSVNSDVTKKKQIPPVCRFKTWMQCHLSPCLETLVVPKPPETPYPVILTTLEDLLI